MPPPRKTELERAATALGRKGGRAKSEAKTRAVRQNITDAWVAKRLTVPERDAIRWALGAYLVSVELEAKDFDTQRRADAESALAKMQPRKEPPHDD